MLPFRHARPVVGMVHLEALPGAPSSTRPLRDVVEGAVEDARALADGGCDGIMVENFGDRPFARRLDPGTLAAMTVAVDAVAKAVRVPVGVNALRNDAPAAMAIAHATGARFVRANVWSGAAWTDQGLIEGCAREALDLRRKLGAEVAVLADAHVKHASHPTTLEQAVTDNERNACDAHIVTGAHTGAAPEAAELERALACAARPVWVGSGATPQNLTSFARAAGFIVGTSLKSGGRVDRKRVEAFVAARDRLR